MNLHPAEIAREIKSYPFFSSFDESLLLQISTMVRTIDFPAGHTVLEPGSQNDRLYFLRDGVMEILVEGEKVNELFQKGDVVGEMSVLTGNPVVAKIRTQSPVRCFYISAPDFVHVTPSQKDRFQFLLYRIYAGILTDRLIKTNEKAKLYEITARELQAKKRELELVTSAQMNFLRSEAKPSQKKVLLLEPNKKQQNIVKTALASTGVQLLLASSVADAQTHFTESKPDVIFCDETSADFLNWSQSQNYAGQFVLIESGQVNFQLLLQLPFVQNVISRDPEDRASTVKNILTTLSKILHRDYFGIEKYLAWGTEVRSVKLTHSGDREQLREVMLTHFKSLGIRGSLLDRVQVASEEMMMNAVYDAPVDSSGKAIYNHLPRTVAVELKKEHQADVRFGCDGNVLAVSVQDPFGSLPRETIVKYLDSCYQNQAGVMNTQKGGAGRGLHQILESCDWTVFNVKPGHLTEVIGLFDLEQAREGVPQFNYFFVP